VQAQRKVLTLVPAKHEQVAMNEENRGLRMFRIARIAEGNEAIRIM